eukprot:SAG31_NODE_185_length_20953_cov_17.235398_7_plen_439_part_00
MSPRNATVASCTIPLYNTTSNPTRSDWNDSNFPLQQNSPKPADSALVGWTPAQKAGSCMLSTGQPDAYTGICTRQPSPGRCLDPLLSGTCYWKSSPSPPSAKCLRSMLAYCGSARPGQSSGSKVACEQCCVAHEKVLMRVPSSRAHRCSMADINFFCGQNASKTNVNTSSAKDKRDSAHWTRKGFAADYPETLVRSAITDQSLPQQGERPLLLTKSGKIDGNFNQRSSGTKEQQATAVVNTVICDCLLPSLAASNPTCPHSYDWGDLLPFLISFALDGIALVLLTPVEELFGFADVFPCCSQEQRKRGYRQEREKSMRQSWVQIGVAPIIFSVDNFLAGGAVKQIVYVIAAKKNLAPSMVYSLCAFCVILGVLGSIVVHLLTEILVLWAWIAPSMCEKIRLGFLLVATLSFLDAGLTLIVTGLTAWVAFVSSIFLQID